jgi:hypothetical protein
MPVYRYIIEDELHCEFVGKYETFDQAQAELHRLAGLPWGERPNLPPCGTGANCCREYILREYETSSEPWTLIREHAGFRIDAAGVVWDTTSNDSKR